MSGLAGVVKILGKQAMKEFATPLKTTGRGKSKKLIPADKPIMRVDESLEESFDDPYLSFEDAFLKNKDKKPEEDLFSDNEDDTFLSNKRVLT